MKVYRFSQNNSGGIFIINDNVCPIVYITAETAEEANKKAEAIGIYFDGVEAEKDCPCCGDRWYRVSEDDTEESLPSYEWDFCWCNYVIFYDADMRPTKIYNKMRAKED